MSHGIAARLTLTSQPGTGGVQLCNWFPSMSTPRLTVGLGEVRPAEPGKDVHHTQRSSFSPMVDAQTVSEQASGAWLRRERIHQGPHATLQEVKRRRDRYPDVEQRETGMHGEPTPAMNDRRDKSTALARTPLRHHRREHRRTREERGCGVAGAGQPLRPCSRAACFFLVRRNLTDCCRGCPERPQTV